MGPGRGPGGTEATSSAGYLIWRKMRLFENIRVENFERTDSARQGVEEFFSKALKCHKKCIAVANYPTDIVQNIFELQYTE